MPSDQDILRFHAPTISAIGHFPSWTRGFDSRHPLSLETAPSYVATIQVLLGHGVAIPGLVA